MEPAYLGRFDNIGNCRRAWVVDFATHVLHPGLQHFIAVGAGVNGLRLCCAIEPNQFVETVRSQNQRFWQDSLLVQQLFAASRGIANGITTWQHRDSVVAISEILNQCGAADEKTLILVLSPTGIRF